MLQELWWPLPTPTFSAGASSTVQSSQKFPHPAVPPGAPPSASSSFTPSRWRPCQTARVEGSFGQVADAGPTFPCGKFFHFHGMTVEKFRFIQIFDLHVCKSRVALKNFEAKKS